MVPLCLSLAVLLCLSFTGAEPLRISLVRRRDPPSIEAFTRAAASLGGEYSYARSSIPKRELLADGADGVFLQGISPGRYYYSERSDYGFTGDIRIGTPPQPMKVYFSTNSADLWVVSGSCTECNATTTFNASASSTFQVDQDPTTPPAPASIDGDPVNGSLVYDVVSLSQDNPPHNQSWILVDQTGFSGLSGFASGTIGLGFNTSDDTKTTPFWKSFFASRQIPPEMGFWLSRNYVGEPIGYLLLGGRDESYYAGDPEFHSVITEDDLTEWRIRLTVNSHNISLQNDSTAYISIDTNLIVGPPGVVKAIYAQIPDSHPLNDSGYWGIPCNTTVAIAMAFGGRSWPINTREMSVEHVSTGSATCLGGITEGFRDAWVIGALFLRHVYTVFRFEPPQIGFAELSFAAGGTTGIPRSANGASAVAPTQTPSFILLTTAASLFAYLI